MAEDIEIDVAYRVPVRHLPRAGVGERLGFERRGARLVLRGVPRGAMEPVSASCGGEVLEGFRHAGRLWRPIRMFVTPPEDDDGAARFATAAAPVELALALLAGEPPRAALAGMLCVTGGALAGPFDPGALPAKLDRARRVEDLGPAALARVGGYVASDLRHDGQAVYVATPHPLAYGLSGARGAGRRLDLAVPDWNLGFRGAAGDPFDLGHYAAFLDAVGEPVDRDDADRLASAAEGLRLDAVPGTALRCFLLEAPGHLARIHRNLVRRPNALAGGPEAARGAVRRLDELAPYAARAAIGIVDDAPGAADAVHRAAAALLAIAPPGRPRDPYRLAEAMRYVETVVWPAVGIEEADAASLVGLAAG